MRQRARAAGAPHRDAELHALEARQGFGGNAGELEDVGARLKLLGGRELEVGARQLCQDAIDRTMILFEARRPPAGEMPVVLAAVGVIYLTVQYGQFPWIAIGLAMSFGLYGLIRKAAPVGPLVGLAVETLLVSLPAIGYLLYLDLVFLSVQQNYFSSTLPKPQKILVSHRL